jgi:hypothetical protein
MKRWHEERKLVEARQELHDRERYHAPGSEEQESLPLGRFRKRKPFACPNARCYLCHGDKLNGVPTNSRLIADQKLVEQLEEAGAELSKYGLNADSTALFRQIVG